MLFRSNPGTFASGNISRKAFDYWKTTGDNTRHPKIFENTHEPIIDQETFDNVQRIRGNVKRYPDGWGEYHPLTGLMYCADCGSKMYVHRTSNYKNIPYYTCSAYTKVPCGTLCLSAHRIKAEVVLNLIQSTLQDIKKSLDENNKTFLHSKIGRAHV